MATHHETFMLDTQTSCFYLCYRTWRLQAYRQFTCWIHGKLGKGVRRVVPACVVKEIRNEFPNAADVYTGFSEPV